MEAKRVLVTGTGGFIGHHLVSYLRRRDMMAQVAGIEVLKDHIPEAEGVRGRNSNDTRLRQILGREPVASLEGGLAPTCAWIEAPVLAIRIASPVAA